jgi:hypothetical protein
MRRSSRLGCDQYFRLLPSSHNIVRICGGQALLLYLFLCLSIFNISLHFFPSLCSSLSLLFLFFLFHSHCPNVSVFQFSMFLRLVASLSFYNPHFNFSVIISFYPPFIPPHSLPLPLSLSLSLSLTTCYCSSVLETIKNYRS